MPPARAARPQTNPGPLPTRCSSRHAPRKPVAADQALVRASGEEFGALLPQRIFEARLDIGDDGVPGKNGRPGPRPPEMAVAQRIGRFGVSCGIGHREAFQMKGPATETLLNAATSRAI